MNLTSPFSLALWTIIGLSLLGVPVGQAMIGGSVLYLYLKGMDMGTVAEQLLQEQPEIATAHLHRWLAGREELLKA